MKIFRRAIAVCMASAVLLTGCSEMELISTLGSSNKKAYKKNKSEYGAVTRQFENAVYGSNIEWLEEILTEYPDYNVNFGYSYDPIIDVVYEGTLTIPYSSRCRTLEYLLDKGLDPNIKLGDGTRLLNTVSAKQTVTSDAIMLNLLLEYGADPNLADTSGFYGDLGAATESNITYRPIYYAMYCPKENAGENLLKHGAEVTYEMLDKIHSVDRIEGSAITFRKALISYLDNGGVSPFSKAEEYAILGDNDNLINELKNGETLTNEQAVTTKYFIYRFGTPEVLEVFNSIYNDLDYRSVTEQRKIPTVEDIVYDANYDLLKYLVDNGDIDVSDKSEALVSAAKAGSYDICKCIIDNGFNIKKFCEDPSIYQSQLLSAAFSGKDIDTFKLIAKYINDNGFLDESCFYEALHKFPIKWNEFIKAAIDYSMDELGFTLRGFPFDNIDYEVAEYLYQKGKPLFINDLPNAIVNGDTRLVKLVLEHGANPNQKDYSGYWTVISDESVEKFNWSYDDFLEWVENADSSVNNSLDTQLIERCRDEKGPLSAYVVKHCSSEAVQLMIDYGMDINNENLTAFAITHGSFKTFVVLYEAGAPLTYRGEKNKKTLMNLALDYGRKDIAAILKKEKIKKY